MWKPGELIRDRNLLKLRMDLTNTEPYKVVKYLIENHDGITDSLSQGSEEQDLYDLLDDKFDVSNKYDGSMIDGSNDAGMFLR